MNNPCSINVKNEIKRNHNICYPDNLIQKFVIKIFKRKPDKDIRKDIKRIKEYMKKKYNCLSQTCWDKHSILFILLIYSV